MNPYVTGLAVFAGLSGSVLLGMHIRRLLPEHHLSAETKDSVKLAMGLVATMSALLLGLLVSSTKDTYDSTRTQVVQMAGRVLLLDRALRDYGPEADNVRAHLYVGVARAYEKLWPGENVLSARTAYYGQRKDVSLAAIEKLTPRDDEQRDIKAKAAALAMDIAQMQELVAAQSAVPISLPLLLVVVFWLVVIFVSFGLNTPPNATGITAQLFAALAVAGAIYMMVELSQPFNGLIRISGQPMLNALHALTKGSP